jgi:hypothetical protein
MSNYPHFGHHFTSDKTLEKMLSWTLIRGEKRVSLDEDDRTIITALGIKIRPKNVWGGRQYYFGGVVYRVIMLRSHEPWVQGSSIDITFDLSTQFYTDAYYRPRSAAGLFSLESSGNLLYIPPGKKSSEVFSRLSKSPALLKNMVLPVFTGPDGRPLPQRRLSSMEGLNADEGSTVVPTHFGGRVLEWSSFAEVWFNILYAIWDINFTDDVDFLMSRAWRAFEYTLVCHYYCCSIVRNELKLYSGHFENFSMWNVIATFNTCLEYRDADSIATRVQYLLDSFFVPAQLYTQGKITITKRNGFYRDWHCDSLDVVTVNGCKYFVGNTLPHGEKWKGVRKLGNHFTRKNTVPVFGILEYPVVDKVDF